MDNTKLNGLVFIIKGDDGTTYGEGLTGHDVEFYTGNLLNKTDEQPTIYTTDGKGYKLLDFIEGCGNFNFKTMFVEMVSKKYSK